MKLKRSADFELKALSAESAVVVAGQLIAISPWKELGYSQEGLTKYLLREDAALQRWAVLRQEKLAGLICVRERFLRGLLLEVLAVFPDFQGSGLGRSLIGAIHIDDPNVKNLWTLVSDFNESAIAFYQRMGFVEAANLKDLVSPGKSELLFRKKI